MYENQTHFFWQTRAAKLVNLFEISDSSPCSIEELLFGARTEPLAPLAVSKEPPCIISAGASETEKTLLSFIALERSVNLLVKLFSFNDGNIAVIRPRVQQPNCKPGKLLSLYAFYLLVCIFYKKMKVGLWLLMFHYTLVCFKLQCSKHWLQIFCSS